MSKDVIQLKMLEILEEKTHNILGFIVHGTPCQVLEQNGNLLIRGFT